MAFTRWYILLVFSMCATQLMMNWFLFGSITKEASRYYHLKEPSSGAVNAQIAALLSLGPFVNILVSPIAVYILRIPVFGLQRAIRISAAAMLIGMVFMCIPSILSSHTLQSAFHYHYEMDGSFSNTTMWLYMGAIVSNISSPIILSSPAKVSVMWFPEHQRNTVTGFAANVSQLGQCLMYFFPPLIVQAPEDLPHLLYMVLSSSIVVFCMAYLYFPAHPKKMPTLAGQISTLSFWHSKRVDPSLYIDANTIWYSNSYDGPTEAQLRSPSVHSPLYIDANVDCKSELLSPVPINMEPKYGRLDSTYQRAGSNPSTKLFAVKLQRKGFKQFVSLLIDDWKRLFSWKQNRSCMLLLLAAGFNLGANAGWSSILQGMMGPVGLSEGQVGSIGASLTIAIVAGGLVGGPIVDRYFRGKLKRVILCVQFVDIIWFTIACLVLPNALWDNRVLIAIGNQTATFVVMWLLAVAIGLNFGMIFVYMELLAEVAYPVPEASSSNALYLIGLPVMIGVIQITSVNASLASPVALGLVAASFVLNCFVVEKYGRPREHGNHLSQQ